MKKLFFTFFLCLFTTCIFAQTVPIDTLINRGIRLHDNGDYPGAIKSYEEALKIDGKSTNALYEIAYTYHKMKNYDKSIFYCNKIVALPFSEELDDAYILIGNSLDLAGKPQEAIATYKTALAKVEPTYMIYYNLAVTYHGLEQYDEEVIELQKGLKLRPQHPGSHLLLGKAMYKKGNRAKALLALYNFLLLEPTTGRSAEAYALLESIWKEGVKKESDKNITITLGNSNDEFSPAEMMLSITQAANLNEINKAKPQLQLFYENTSSFFSTLSELKKNQSNFWWNFYVDFFTEMQEKKHTETFCYYINLANESRFDDAKSWLISHDQNITDFDNWYEKVGRHF